MTWSKVCTLLITTQCLMYVPFHEVKSEIESDVGIASMILLVVLCMQEMSGSLAKNTSA